MKHIFAVLLAAVLLITMLGGCARDMSGETRTTSTPGAASTPGTTSTRAPASSPVRTPAATDSTADGIIDAGRDAVDGVVGTGEEALDDIMDAGEDLVDDMTGSTARPDATPRATASR